jgi:hypothetical protein
MTAQCGSLVAGGWNQTLVPGRARGPPSPQPRLERTNRLGLESAIGFIVFDNSERWQYNAGYRALHGFGFRRIDFHGLGPVGRHEWCTSMFAKNLDAFATNVERRKGGGLGW